MFPTEQAFPAAVRATLYKNRAAYIAQVERHLRGLVAMRYLLAEGQLHQMKQVEAAAW
jgi:hypothetical protein